MQGVHERPLIQNECRAVIDVGTNSTKILVGLVQGSEVTPLFEKGEQTRLGSGLFSSGRLHPEAIIRTAEAAARLKNEAVPFQPTLITALATSAAREAENADELVRAFSELAGLDLTIISGETEANLAFRGVTTADPQLLSRPILVTDVGGGSTEFIVGRSGVRSFSRSFRMGAVRFFESLRLSDRPDPSDLARCRAAVDDLLQTEVLPVLGYEHESRLDSAEPEYIGVGGTAIILARIHHGLRGYDRAKIEQTAIPAERMAEMTEELWSLSLDERRQLPGLPPERADIILTGIAIHEGILRSLQLPSLRPSTRGLRFAALLELAMMRPFDGLPLSQPP